MQTAKRSVAVKLIAILLLVVMLCPVQAFAVESRASYYLSTYSAYVYNAAWGKVQVWFDVQGTNVMDEIGALQIQLYESTDNENWYWVNTFLHEDYGTMLAQNTFAHMNYVPYHAVPGRYYKAYVQVWAGPEDGGDTRYFWTPVERCT